MVRLVTLLLEWRHHIHTNMAGIILNPSSGTHSIIKIDCGSSSPFLGGTVNLQPFVFLQDFEGGDNNLSEVTGFSALNSLLNFKITGSNTVDFQSSEFPPNLQNIDIRGSNTIGGLLSELPSTLKSILLTGSTFIGGNISGMPSGIQYINITGNNKIVGNLNEMNCPVCAYFNIAGTHAIAGTIDNLPPNLTYFSLSNTPNNQTTGSIANLPNTLKTYSNGTNGNVTGDVADLPSSLEFFSMSGANTTTGDIGDLPSTIKYFSNGGQNTTTGSLKDLPAGITFYSNRGRNTATGYYDGTVTGAGQRAWAQNMRFFTVLPFTLGMTQQELVTLLIDLSLTSWDPSFSGKKVQIDGPNNPTVNLTSYPSAQTAITNLQNKGVQVLVNTTT